MLDSTPLPFVNRVNERTYEELQDDFRALLRRTAANAVVLEDDAHAVLEYILTEVDLTEIEALKQLYK